MSRLFIFGDSFAENNKGSWVELLANQLNVTVISKAVAGSSMEYSFLELLKSVDSFRSDDVVVFVLTEEERLDLHFNLSIDPMTGFFNLIKTVLNMKFLKSHSWAEDNKEHIEWYVNNRSQDMLKNKFLLYLSFIRTLSLKYKDVNFLIIPAFPSSIDLKNKVFNNILEPDNNFLILKSFSLCEISDADWNYSKKVRKNFDRFFQGDPRVNHLTNDNNKILADSIFKIIKYKDTVHYKLSNFKVGSLVDTVSSVNDIYKLFVETGVLNRSNVEATLKEEYCRV